MNERIAAISAVLVAEIGSSICLALFLPENTVFRTVQIPSHLLMPQVLTVLALGIIAALLAWIIVPKIWRVRQLRRSKLRTLSWVGTFLLLFTGAVTIYYFEEGSAWFGAAADFDHGYRGVARALLVQLSATLLLYCAVIAVMLSLSKRKVGQVTASPKFGKS